MRNTASYLRIVGYGVFMYLFLDSIGSSGNDTSIFIEQPWLWAILGILLLLLIAGEICHAALKNILYKSLKPEAKKRYDKAEKLEKSNQFKGIKQRYKRLLDSKPMEMEQEIVLDHNYDGIQELDNNLPPWWVYGFYASIVFAAVYLIRFEVFNDYTQIDEYEDAVAKAQIEIEEYRKTAKDLIDVNTVQLLTEVSDLNAGKSIFEGNCAACHKVTGAGGIGPNLTDDHWILGGGIKNVFNTISEGGRSGKGMVAWKSDLKPSQMAQVASYVLSLHGSKPPDAKAPEGEIWLDPDAPVEEINVKVIDSTKIQVLIEDQPVTGNVVKNNANNR